MSTRDYQRGVETFARAHYAFMKKQGDATEELGKRLVKKINRWGKVVDVLVETLSQIERERIFGVGTSLDIGILDENEKILLLAYLKAFATRKGQNTSQQNDYFFNVKKYLNISNVDDDIEFAAISQLDISRSELMAFLECVCEFLFLKSGSRSFVKKFKSELECFGLSDKVIEEIVVSIEKTYQFFGLQGIVDHYDLEPIRKEEKEPEKLSIPFFEKSIVLVYSSRSKNGNTRAKMLQVHIQEQLAKLNLECSVEIYAGDEAKMKRNIFEKENVNIIYIGEPTMSEPLYKIIDRWDFDEFGMKYVTRGRESIIMVNELKEKQYNDFLEFAKEQGLRQECDIEKNLKSQEDTILKTAFDKDEPIAVNVMVGILASWLILPSAILDASSRADDKAKLKNLQYSIAMDKFVASKIDPYVKKKD